MANESLIKRLIDIEITFLNCTQLLASLSANLMTNSTLIIAVRYDEPAQIHFRLKSTNRCNQAIPANCFVHCCCFCSFRCGQTIMGKKYVSSVHVAPLSVQYLLIQPIQQESIEMRSYIDFQAIRHHFAGFSFAVKSSREKQIT